jgi:predicted enzyme related to lactoylglutathione lyase
MAIFKEHHPGTLSYVELITADAQGAKDFYMNLFGWSIRDEDMGQQGVYTQFLKEGDVTGAMFEQTPDMKEASVTSHWNIYLTVEDADQAVARARELGGEVMMGPMEVYTHGRMAVLSDTVGAKFCIWEPGDRIGLGRKEESATLCWAEHMTGDRTKSQAFYEGLFGWMTQGMEMGETGTYHMMGYSPEQMCCGMMEISPEMGPVPPHWLPYIQVDDLDAVMRKASDLGGKIAVPVTDIPGGSRFSVLQDPQGARLGVYQPGDEPCED